MKRFLQFNDWPIGVKLTVIFLVLTLIPLSVIVFLNDRGTRTSLIEQTQLNIGTHADDLAKTLDDLFAERQRNIQIVSGAPAVREFMLEANPTEEQTQRALRVLNATASTSPLFDVYIMNLEGEVVNSTVDNVGQNFGFRPYFTEALAGNTYISDVSTSVDLGKSVMYYSTPIKDFEDKNIIGTGILRVQAEELWEILRGEANQAGEGSFGILIDENGVRIGHSTAQELVFHPIAPLDPAFIDQQVEANRFAADTRELLSQTESIPDITGAIATDARFFTARVLANNVTNEAVLAKLSSKPWTWAFIVPQSTFFASINTLTRNALILAVVVAVIVIITVVFFTRLLTRPVNAIMDLFGEIGMGNFAARAEVTSQDELGTMATSLNSMLDNTLTLIQTSEERDAMQTSIMKLLDEVSGIAEGDLTGEAEVTADMAGALADAFNLTVLQLREIIGNVQNATIEVSSSANQIQNTAEHLAQDNETQATQIVETSKNAQQGTQAVQDTIEGMNRIRDQVQETAKRIKRLGESSQEIGEIVQLISDIADRTSILALNASIQAAMAGEAGRGFAVVAEEVERLAVRSTDATKQITTLIRTIQSETTEAVTAMETTTHEVVEGSQLANQAGQVLQELSASMGDIAKVTEQTAAGTKEASVAIRSLAVLADNLRGSVSAFKLPETNGRGA